jgi:hypothetical protein
MRMRVQDWHRLKRLEKDGRFAHALAEAVEVCRTCQRYLLVDGCLGCSLKQLRRTFTVKLVELAKKEVKTR